SSRDAPDAPSRRTCLLQAALARDPDPVAQAPHDVNGGVVGAAGEGRARAGESLERDRNPLGHVVDAEESSQVVRDRVEAARVHESRAGALRLLVVAKPHEVYELGLSGEVDIVGPGGGACRDYGLAVTDVRADSRDQDLRRLRQR